VRSFWLSIRRSAREHSEMYYLWALPTASLNVSSFSLEFDRRVLLLGSSMLGLGVIGLSSGEILKRGGRVLNIYQEFMVSGVSASVGLIYMVFEHEMYQPQQGPSSGLASGSKPYRYEQETLYLSADIYGNTALVKQKVESNVAHGRIGPVAFEGTKGEITLHSIKLVPLL